MRTGSWRRRFAVLITAAMIQLPSMGRSGSSEDAVQVQSILHDRCHSCHNPRLLQGGLSLQTLTDVLKGGVSGPALAPGSSRESLLFQRVSGIKEPRMPFRKEPLNPQELALLRRWIDQGANWPSDQPPPAATPRLAPRWPRVPEQPAHLTNPIDRFVAAHLSAQGKLFPQPVPDRVFLRRVHLDLWGLLPSPREVESFLWEESDGKRERQVRTLLEDSDRYAQHWMSYWNDLLRNDEGVRYHGEREPISEWLRKALQENLSYDRLVQALLNPAAEDDPRGFLVGVNWRGEISASQSRPMQAAQNSAHLFLGVNLKCASCHDSFVDRWKLSDSYGLASLFAEEELELVRCDVPLGRTAAPRLIFPELGQISAGDLEQRRRQAAALFTSPRNGRFARTLVNRIWGRLLGRGLVQAMDDPESTAWSPDLLDWLAWDFVENGHDLRRLLAQILTSRTYRMPSVQDSPPEESSAPFGGPVPRRLSAEQFLDGVSSVTGEWKILRSGSGDPGRPSRAWRFKSSPLTRSLGRPIRDQVVLERNHESSTLQALELSFGDELNRMIRRGAARLAGQLRPTPRNHFDSGDMSWGKAEVDVDVEGFRELRLLAVDMDSYDPSRVRVAWAAAELVGPGGVTPLRQLPGEGTFEEGPVRFVERKIRRVAAADGTTASVADKTPYPYSEALITGLPGELVFPLEEKGFTRFRAVVGVDEGSLESDIHPTVRFFVFDREPDRDRLLREEGDPPVARAPHRFSAEGLVTYLYRYCLARDPTASERELALSLLGTPGPAEELDTEGVEDLLWSVFLSPEFQTVR